MLQKEKAAGELRTQQEGSSRQGQGNTCSTPQLWRTGEVTKLSDHVDTGGSGGPLNDFAVVEENELEVERRHTGRLV